jgi:hypothetical protein
MATDVVTAASADWPRTLSISIKPMKGESGRYLTAKYSAVDFSAPSAAGRRGPSGHKKARSPGAGLLRAMAGYAVLSIGPACLEKSESLQAADPSSLTVVRNFSNVASKGS